jgi:glycosyltransferase involved in cell wall biosynthesis
MRLGLWTAPTCIGKKSKMYTDHPEYLAEDPDGKLEDHLPKGEVDCLVYGDVLEHMVHPWRVLKEQKHWLKAGGQVLACIPNIGHWTILLGLLHGRFRYQNEGLLDRTHLRFFTLEGIKDLFCKADLYLYDVQTRLGVNEDADRFRKILKPVVDTLKIDQNQFARQTSTIQYVACALNQNLPPRRLLIQTLLLAPLACDRVRVYEPDRFSATIPGVRTISSVRKTNLDTGQIKEDKVFIMQRPGLKRPFGVELLKHIQKKGFLMVAEMDDDPLFFPSHEAENFLSFRGVHAIQTSTPELAKWFREINPNVAVFRNQLESLPPPRTYASDGPIVLFFGALNREKDWHPLMPTLNQVLKRFGKKVAANVIHDRNFFEALEIEQKRFLPFSPYKDYIRLLRDSELAFLPLAPTRFNRMKSDLKFIECAGHGVCVLASPTVYEKSIVDGKTGVLFRSKEEFETRLTELLIKQDLRRKIAAEAYKYVSSERLLCRHYKERVHWYFQLLNNLPDLNRELKVREPSIFN